MKVILVEDGTVVRMANARVRSNARPARIPVLMMSNLHNWKNSDYRKKERIVFRRIEG